MTVRPLGSGLTAPDLTDGSVNHASTTARHTTTCVPQPSTSPRTPARPRCVPGLYTSRWDAPGSGAVYLARMTQDLKLGLQFGYWTAAPRPARDLIALATPAEDLGFDSVWTGESWSSDAFSPLAAVAGATSRVRLCTGIAQIAARTPTAMAMHAMTLDGLSEGRAAVGIGVSGPQVVEGWYGRPFGQPLARTREYVADHARRAGAGRRRSRRRARTTRSPTPARARWASASR